MQETLKSYEPDETRTVADLLGAVVTDVLQDLELMSDDVAVTVECFRYDDTERTQVKLESCLDDDASSVQWTVPIGQSYVSSFLCQHLLFRAFLDNVFH